MCASSAAKSGCGSRHNCQAGSKRIARPHAKSKRRLRQCFPCRFGTRCTKVPSVEGDINMEVPSHAPRTEDAISSVTTLRSPDDLIVPGQPFFGKKRLMKDDYDPKENCRQVRLDPRVWKKLSEELMTQIFARLSVKEIRRIRAFNKHWRSAITSPGFQQAFADASVVRVGLMISHWKDGTVFLTQENKEECFRSVPEFHISRYPDSSGWSYAAATAGGLVCVIEVLALQPSRSHYSGVVKMRVYVSNPVTGIHRELPSPHITTTPPKLVRMETNVGGGGYTITFIYTKDLKLEEVSSWQVYNSLSNTWSDGDVGALAHLKDVEIFYLLNNEYMFYENVATFHKETKAINVFNLHGSFTGTYANFDPNGHAHNISGELFKLCKRGEQYGVWKCTRSGTWEMVCKCPYLEEMCSSLRVMNDWVVLIFKFPSQIKNEHDDGTFSYSPGTIVKVYNLTTKTWHTFPEAEYFMYSMSLGNGEMFNTHFIVELRFDAIP